MKNTDENRPFLRSHSMERSSNCIISRIIGRINFFFDKERKTATTSETFRSPSFSQGMGKKRAMALRLASSRAIKAFKSLIVYLISIDLISHSCLKKKTQVKKLWHRFPTNSSDQRPIYYHPLTCVASLVEIDEVEELPRYFLRL